MISTTDITLTRQGKTLLDKVSLTISKGDFISIIGPNGAGKTTLLKVLLGVLHADTGTVNRVPGLKIGYMPQQLQMESLFPLNAKRFLTLARKIGQDKLDRIINEVKIANVLSKPMSSLSGGELQRILLARALLNDPDLLILDESAQGLTNRQDCRFGRRSRASAGDPWTDRINPFLSANFQKGFLNQKYGRREAPSVLHSPQNSDSKRIRHAPRGSN